MAFHGPRKTSKEVAMKAYALVMVLSLALTGCPLGEAPAPEVAPSYTPAAKVEEPPPAPPVVETPVPVPLPGQLKPLPAAEASRGKGKRGRDPQANITQAQAEARQEPTPEGYFNSLQ